MALDPGLAAFLETVNASGHAETDDVASARDGWGVINSLDGEPEPVTHVDDGALPGPGGSLPYRRYRPSDDSELPVVVWFHGGGFVLGSLDTTDRTARKLANRSGACVMSIDYRLAPEAPFPAAVDDAWAATRWVHENAEDLGVDPSRMAVGGDSAGGGLAAIVAQRAAAEGLSLALQVLLYPTVDATLSHPSVAENGEGYLLTAHRMRWFYNHYVPAGHDPLDPLLSPLHAPDVAGVAPAHIVVAGFDPLRDDGIAYARKLGDAGVDVELMTFDDQIHAFATLGLITPRGNEALAAMGAALRRAFH